MSSSIFRRWSALLPELIACSTQWDDMVAKNFLFETPQSSTHRRDLRYDVDAISVLLDHSGESSDLPLDSDEALFA